jgi:hypothetical protein
MVDRLGGKAEPEDLLPCSDSGNFAAARGIGTGFTRDAVCKAAPGPQSDMGKVMGQVKAKLAGRADMGQGEGAARLGPRLAALGAGVPVKHASQCRRSWASAAGGVLPQVAPSANCGVTMYTHSYALSFTSSSRTTDSPMRTP